MATIDIGMPPGRKGGGNNNNNNNNGNNDDDDNNITTDLELHDAASTGDIVAARRLIREKPQLIRSGDKNLNLPLHLSVLHDCNEVSECLVAQHPGGCYALNRQRISPLHLAFNRKNTRLINNFISCFNSGDAQNLGTKLEDHMRSIVSCAIEDEKQDINTLKALFRGRRGLVTMLDEKCQPPIIDAGRCRRVAIVELLIGDYPESICTVDGHGDTILHVIARQNNEMLNCLVPELLNTDKGEILLKMMNENQDRALADAKQNKNKYVADIIKQKMKQLGIPE